MASSLPEFASILADIHFAIKLKTIHMKELQYMHNNLGITNEINTNHYNYSLVHSFHLILHQV